MQLLEAARAACAGGQGAARLGEPLRGGEGSGAAPVNYLSALTPPLLTCAVVVIAIVAFLRHELAKKRPDQAERPADEPGAQDDQPAADPSSDQPSAGPSSRP